MDENVRLGALLKHRRQELGLTLEMLAERVGITAGALSHIESGRRLPDPKNAVRIAEALEWPADDALRMLDEAHANRRRSQAYSIGRPERPTGPAGAAATAQGLRADSSGPYRSLPIEDLFDGDPRPGRSRRTSPGSGPLPIESARWSSDTGERLRSMDFLAEQASDAVRILRGLLDDEDPKVAREARRLLKGLDVRLPEE